MTLERSEKMLQYLPFRKRYEGYAAAAWAASCAAGLAIGNQAVNMPINPYHYIAAGAGFLAAYRLWPVLVMTRNKKHLKPRKLEFTEITELLRLRKESHIWLGNGFEWSKAQTQMAYEILSRDIDDLNLGDTGMGSGWIHGVGFKEEPVHIPIGNFGVHTLIAGTTGAGKTRMLDLLVTQAIALGDAVLIIDPKSDVDLKNSAKRACDYLGRGNDFTYFNPAFPEKSIRLNPLKAWNRSTEVANRIAALIPSESGGNVFKAFSQMVLDKVIQGMLAARMEPTLLKIRRCLEGGVEDLLLEVFEIYFAEHLGSDWQESEKIQRYENNASSVVGRVKAYTRYYRENIGKEHPLIAIDGLIAMSDHERDHLQKMIASLLPVLNILTSSHMGELLSPVPESDDPREIGNLSSLINRNQVCYIGLDSLSDGMTGSAIGSLFLSELTSVAGHRYNFDSGKKRRVWVFVDEAAEVVDESAFIQLLNKSRGAGFNVVVCTQTLSDFSARLGSEDKARQILANINTIVALRLLDGPTQEYIAETLHKTRITTRQINTGMNTDGEAPILHSNSYGERTTAEESELFPAALLGQLPNLHYVMRVPEGRLIKGWIPILVEEQPETAA
ncbi:conjugative transfer system coupling protein TraD [Thiolapillus sp.]|uniref:conjugative transfer system coupling protein TraD n=7 Tax=Thiolapillus sp. TaxID=2017437 RepID=UPI003AF7D1CC